VKLVAALREDLVSAPATYRDDFELFVSFGGST
jgi:hypothetical protein